MEPKEMNALDPSSESSKKEAYIHKNSINSGPEMVMRNDKRIREK